MKVTVSFRRYNLRLLFAAVSIVAIALAFVVKATGGPDALRGIYPVVAAIDVDGWVRLDDDDLAERYARIIQEVSGRSEPR